ncbi:MAG: hypothetical protein CMB77_04320 [Euryarchaeota archaeon]|nr:hypothetical protein [Euryarchaeota archaeon]|tara:strand:+ start:12906 stop:15218 length:2313 start_codon:yes stop_codon:yes gene_type:complete
MAKKEDIKYSFDGISAKFSKAVVIAISKPPKWRSPLSSDGTNDELFDVKNLNFENVFVYNFYTQDERTKYNFRNSTFNESPDGLVDNILVDKTIRDITGKKIRGRSHISEVTSNMIPSYIRLSWEPPPGFTHNSRIADKSRIDAFKYLAGLSRAPKGQTYEIDPVSRENFELQQQDYVRATNEYLDMFSFDPDGSSVNNWFAEEIDSTHFQRRMDFLYQEIVSPEKHYKNFSGPGVGTGEDPNIGENILDSTADEFNNTSMAEEHSVVQVYDSALLEDLNFPSWDRALPEDTTIVLNTDWAWSIAGASSKASGMLLGMQTRVRNIKYWQEVLIKSGTGKIAQVDFDNILKPTGRAAGPLEQIVENSFPYDIEDLNRHAGQTDLDFKLVGFVIEKTQRVETEKTERKPEGEQDEVQWAYEKFPLIFVPCNPNNIVTSHIDAAVNYDKEYDYTIRAVFSFSLNVPVEVDGAIKNLTFHYFLNSPHSTILTVETREVQPPPYPRDVWAFHEYYTGDDGALALHWAFPVNKQRDVTYFAVFRRSSIYEPFRLLRVYDFNYSISSPEQSAAEIKARIYGHSPGDFNFFNEGENDTRGKIKRLRPGEVNTMFKDKEFKPNTDYIYAVCAIDAHGQMSNYSAQLKVRLDSRLYKLDIRQISPPGAPLVLPNFFIKTKAFEDVARTANYRKATLRFRPDYKSVKVNNAVKKLVHGIDERPDAGGDESNCYFLQIINPDRANDIVLRYQINDKLELENDEETLAVVAHLAGLPKNNLKT